MMDCMTRSVDNICRVDYDNIIEIILILFSQINFYLFISNINFFDYSIMY